MSRNLGDRKTVLKYDYIYILRDYTYDIKISIE